MAEWDVTVCGREWIEGGLRRECAMTRGHNGEHIDRLGRHSFAEPESEDYGTEAPRG